jgi:ELWxxDGT repeat protein
MGGYAVFEAQYARNKTALYRTDGTKKGTNVIGPAYGWGSPVAVGKVIYFTGTDHRGSELWRTDGTKKGTKLVKDIAKGSIGSYPEQMTPAGKRFYFAATTPAHGKELWVSDGTSKGTKLVKNLRSGAVGSNPTPLFFFKNAFYFGADRADGSRPLWKTSGTSSSTKAVARLDGLPTSNAGCRTR